MGHIFQKKGYSGIIPFVYEGKKKYLSICNMKSL